MVMGLVLVLAALPLPKLEATPKWVTTVEVPSPPEKPSGGFHTLLRDTQIRVGKTTETYERRVWKVLNQPGVESLAKQEISWNATNVVLVLHGIWVWRNGQRRDAWQPEDARVLPRESDLAASLYDGRQTLVLELRDVRPGDLVEYAYTLRGENPVFQNHVTFWAWQAEETPVSLSHYALTWLRDPKLNVFPRAGAKRPDEAPVPGGTVFSWSLRDVKAFAWESNAPHDVEQVPSVVFTDWNDWAAVRAWAEPLFALPAVGADFDRIVKRLKALPEAQRAQEAVHVVQDEIRYVGVELGKHSHQPHAPAWVLERGFGDCKDKALLLVSLLRAVGLEAWPALVDADASPGFERQPPSAFAFNHAIALVNLPSGPTFIDGTLTLNRGPLEQREPVPYRFALVVRPGETGLTPIDHPMPPRPTWDVTQRWTMRADDSADLTIDTVARGHQAPLLRRSIESENREELERRWKERRAEDFDTALKLVSFEWKDEPDLETFTLTERYRVKRFHSKEGEHEFKAEVIERELIWLPETPRTHPWAVDAPTFVHERIEWTDHGALQPSRFRSEKEVVDGEVFLLDSQQGVQRGKLVLDWTLQLTEPQLEPSQFAAHRIATQKAAATTRYIVTAGATKGVQAAEKETDVATIGLASGIGIGFLVLLATASSLQQRWQRWRAGARGREFQKRHRADAGETSATAARLGSLSEANRLFRSSRCPRGHEWKAPEPTDTVRLGEERLTVVTRACTTCDAKEVRYVKVPQH